MSEVEFVICGTGTYSINPNGLLWKKAVWDASGNKQYITYEYDYWGDVNKITYPDNGEDGGYLLYDRVGKLFGGFVQQIIDYRDDANRPGDLGSTFKYQYYWPLNKIKSYTDCNNYTVNYDYSFSYGQPTHIDVNAPNGGGLIYNVNYVYDRAGRLVDVCEPLLGANNLIAGFSYDKNGNRSQLNYYRDGTKNPTNTTTITYSYNLDNMLKGFNTTNGPTFSFNASGTGNIDGLGRLTGADEVITKNDQTTVGHNYAYQYDWRSQLLAAYMETNGSSWVGDTYSYDKAGNVQQRGYETSSDPLATTSFTFDGDLMLSGQGGGGSDFNAVWNANGNLTRRDQSSDANFTYNWDNKLCRAQKPPFTVTIKYDPMGNRIYRTLNTVNKRKYIVDVSGDLPVILLEIDANDSSLKRTYVYANSEILAQHNGPAATADANFFLHDRLGSVREVMDKNGMVKKYFTYDPFGKLREGSTLSSDYPFGFTGQWYDYEFGQYYLRARQYDPILMRLTTEDPIDGDYEEPMTLHKYLYCLNEPVNHSDPSGHIALPASATALYAEVALYAIATTIAIEALWQDNDRLFDAALELVTVIPTVFQQALNKFGEMKGGKQKDRDKDLWKFKDRFKGDPERWKKFRKFVEQKTGKAGKDADKIELEELYEEFMNGGY